MTDLFEYATRKALRFPSVVGLLTTEDVWKLPLQSRNGADLDTVAKAVNQKLKDVITESFVSTGANPAKTGLEIQLEIVKHIISVKLAENEEVRNRRAKKAEKEKLLAILDSKQDEELQSLSKDELVARIGALD